MNKYSRIMKTSLQLKDVFFPIVHFYLVIKLDPIMS